MTDRKTVVSNDPSLSPHTHSQTSIRLQGNTHTHSNANASRYKAHTYTHSLMTLLSSGFLSAFCQYSPFTVIAMLIRYKGYNNISLLLYREATNTISITQLRVIRTKDLTELAWVGAVLFDTLLC